MALHKGQEEVGRENILEATKEFIGDVLECRRADYTEEPGKISLKRLKEISAEEKQANLSKFKIGDFASTSWLSDALSREVSENL